MKPYLAETGSNTNDAIRLFQWNIELSAAAYELLHFFEVALRNAIDAQLCRWNADQVRDGAGLGRDWLMDPASLLNRLAGKDIAEAKRRAGVAARRRTGPRKHAPVEHADVLANLSLGTWRHLLPDNDEGRQLLWREAIVNAFPVRSRAPRDLTNAVNRVLLLPRNRVAHLEPPLNTNNVQAQLTNMRIVLEVVDPLLAQWAMGWQRITATIRARPV